MRNLFNKLQVWKKKQYYKKYCIPLPIDENLIVFESFLGKQYACSPKAIYEAIKNDPQYANYCFAWMFQSVNQNRMMLGDERTVIVRYGSNFLYQYNDDEVMQIKKMLGISEKKKVILYAPAQRDN